MGAAGAGAAVGMGAADGEVEAGPVEAGPGAGRAADGVAGGAGGRVDPDTGGEDAVLLDPDAPPRGPAAAGGCASVLWSCPNAVRGAAVPAARERSNDSAARFRAASSSLTLRASDPVTTWVPRYVHAPPFGSSASPFRKYRRAAMDHAAPDERE